jgi:D-alanyl-D-alanine dipeptidase
MALLPTFALTICSVGILAQSAKPASDVLAHSQQLIAVVTPDWNSVDGKLQRYERRSAKKAWQPVGDSIPIVVGKNGLGWGRGLVPSPTDTGHTKKEGDGRSPAGVFALGTVFGYAPEKLSGSKLPYLTLTPSIECVDDVNSTHYNRIVDRSTVTPDWSSSEHMRNTGESYRWGVVIDHNGIAAAPSSLHTVQGGGSCIFLHIWQGAGHGTAGCTAMTPANIESLIAWLDPKRKPLLVQLTADDYARLMKQWSLPTVVNLPAR